MVAASLDGLNWRDAEDYAFTTGFSGGQWAWQFLRRNPDYQAEWRAFISTWRALERDYGRAPNRDFCQWKNDPRAWVPASECGAGDCRIDQDKVLIECALGARWGFHKFPPDPAMRDAVGDGKLNWRENTIEIQRVDVGHPLADDDAARIALAFDLSLPLKAQIEQAKRLLQLEQRGRVREGRILAPRAAAHAEEWRRYLRLLDAGASGASPSEMRATWPDADIDADRVEADRLRDGGYRRIALLP